MMPKDGGIGASMKRREDVRFLTGKGRYTDDINRPGQTTSHFVRSDVAHGRIKWIDTGRRGDAGRAQDLHRRRTSPASAACPAAGRSTDRVGKPMQEPKHPVLADGKVRHVGDPIAAVVAETWPRRGTRPRRSTSTSRSCRRSST